MNDEIKTAISAAFLILVAGIVILGVVSALMYLSAYIETTMIVH